MKNIKKIIGEENVKQNKIERIMSATLKNVKSMIDVNTIVGDPINTIEGRTIIPISTVTIGFLTGGGEYGDVKILKENECLPFSGGSGAVVSIKPSGFLIDNGSGVKVVEGVRSNNVYEKLMETAIEFFSEIKEDK